jgi:hypothetical protein
VFIVIKNTFQEFKEMNATQKKIMKDYTRDGKEKFEFCILDDEGYIKTVSPRQFHFLTLPDTTIESTFSAYVNYRVSQLSFRDRVDINGMINRGKLEKTPKAIFQKMLEITRKEF